MEALSNYSGSLGNFELKLDKTDTHLTIEVENMLTSKLYCTRLTTDILPEIAKTLFDDLDGFTQALVAGLEKSNPDLKILISDDAKITVEYKTMIINKEKHFTFSLPLEGKDISDSERFERSQTKLLRKILELETKLKQKNGIVGSEDFQEIYPTFDSTSRNAAQFTFSNQNKTVVCNAPSAWNAIFAKDALPINERSRFSVKIERSCRPTMEFFVGIAAANHKTTAQSCNNGVGCYMLNTTNNYAYANNVNSQGSAILVTHPGDTVFVLADLKEGRIYFEVDGVIVFRGKIDLSNINTYPLFPCVNLAYNTDSLSFV